MIKIHARELIKGKGIYCLLLFFCPIITFFSAVFCTLIAVMCSVYGNEACFGTLSIFPYIQKLSFAVPLFFLCAASFLFIFTFALNATKKAYFFHLADKNTISPICNITMHFALRYAKKTFIVFLIKLLWFICFFSPFILCCTVIASQLYSQGISKSIFIVLSILSLILLITGIIFFSVSLCRFFLTDYILSLNPKISATEAVRASVLLCEGKTAYILRSKLMTFPWRIAGMSFFLFGFSYSYIAMINALVCEKCYGENKYVKNQKNSAVTFIINKKTKMYKTN